MGWLGLVKDAATAANVVKGLCLIFAAAISGWVAVEAWAVNYSNPIVILCALTAAVLALALVYVIFRLYERVTFYLTTRREQNRIEEYLNNLGSDVVDLDLMTAAGIWADSLAAENVRRHSYFRGLKSAVRANELVVTHRPVPKHGPSIRVDLNSLKDYWRKRGVNR